MLDFVYHSPTKIIFGKGAELQVGGEIKALGHRKVLVHFGGGSALRSGLIDRIHASLERAGLAYVDLGGVMPNPRLGLVREGIELCRREGVDFLLGVGGGSAIDSAKAIGYGLADDGDVWDFYLQKRRATACYPVGAVLTIAAAGSETSNSSVIMSDDDRNKRSYNTDLARPKFAIMNPELTYTLPPFQSMCGVVDILMHTIERHVSDDKNTEVIDEMSEGLMRAVLHNGPKVLADPADYNARAELMWAGSLSHNGLTGAGRTGDWGSHLLEHELSALFDVAHGAGLSVIWPSWARYARKSVLPRLARFSVRVMGCPMNFDNPEETALEGIDALEDFFRRIGMPVRMAELGVGGVSDAHIEKMVDMCSWKGTKTIGNFVKLGADDMREIYRAAR